jgi:hypothetical protein
MKKLVIACLACAALASLSACTTGKENEAVYPPGTIIRSGMEPRSQVPFPDTYGATTGSGVLPNNP